MKNNGIALKMTAAFICMLISVSAVSCAGSDTGASDTPQMPAGDIETASAVPETEAEIPLPDVDYAGAELNIIYLVSGYAGQDYNDIYVAEQSGDSVDDGTYERNRLAEELLNINISAVSSDQPTSAVMKSVQSGDGAYQLVQDKGVSMMSSLAPEKMLMDMNAIPGLNLDQKWYNQRFHASTSIAGKLYMISCDMTVSDKIGMACTMYNKKLASDFSLPDMYAVVSDGKWTIDNLASYISAASADIDGNGKMDKNDRYGLLCEDFYGWFMMVTGGAMIAEKDKDDIPYFTVVSDRAVTVLGKIQDIMYDKERRAGSNYVIEDYYSMFGENRALFHMNVLSTVAQYRDMESDFGIIPLPKYDEAQDSYISTMSNYVSRYLAVPVTVNDPGMVGNVVDVMSRFGGDTVVKGYYDILLKGKVSRDNDSEEMLNLIFDTMIVDLGSVYNWGGCWFMYQQHFSGKDVNIVSSWEKISSSAQADLDKMISTFIDG